MAQAGMASVSSRHVGKSPHFSLNRRRIVGEEAKRRARNFRLRTDLRRHFFFD
jgi:hypothetical protein